jgi:anti-sigma B factor antagonist
VDLRTDIRDSIAVVTVTGDIDMSTAPTLEARLAELTDDGAARTLVIDLNTVDFLDSSALGVLVGAHKRATATGGSIRVVCDQPRIERVFAITRLTEVIPVFATVAAATDAG